MTFPKENINRITSKENKQKSPFNAPDNVELSDDELLAVVGGAGTDLDRKDHQNGGVGGTAGAVAAAAAG